VRRVVLRAHHNLLRPRICQCVRNVDREGSVAALVPAYCRAIDPYLCEIIDRAKMEKCTMTAGYDRPLDLPSVPYGTIEGWIRDSAGLCLRRKRDHDGSVPNDLLRAQKHALAIDRELPFAVQGCPIVTLKLRARVGLIAVNESALKKIFNGILRLLQP